jgi:Cd2+/Zn2+-exporting ATPase
VTLQQTIRQQFRVGGMDCPSCAVRIERGLRAVPGVAAAEVQFAAGRVTVTYQPGVVAPTTLTEAIQRLGHTAEPLERGGAPAPPAHAGCCSDAPSDSSRATTGSGPVGCCSAPSVAIGRPGSDREASRPAGLAARLAGWAPTLLAAAGIAAAFLAERLGASPLVWQSLYGAGVLIGGGPVARAALTALRARHTTDIHFLMVIAVLGAVALGQWAEAATVLVLFSIAGALEGHSMERAREAIRALVRLAPPTARVRQGEGERLVPAAEVEVGERLLIRPGDRIPLDGEVVAGSSTVNQAVITGEAIPVEKAPGDPVFAGTFNERGSLEVKVTRAASESTLARIIELVEEAQANRAPTEQLIDRFARVYTPVVLLTAALLATVPPLLFHASWSAWIYRALTLLIVACPCALVISTPVAIVCALTRAARSGALVKGGAVLERLGGLKAIAFDKTGTLTRGRPRLTDVIPLNGIGPRELLRLAGGVERHSEHAVGQAIRDRALDEGLSLPEPAGFEALTGLGARAVVEGRHFSIGKPAMLAVGSIDDEVARRTRVLQEEGKTVVWIAEERQLLGLLGVADAPRERAREAVTALRALGIGRIEMLTGDNAATAAAVAREVGIQSVHAELLPTEKVERLRSLQAEAGPVAMVGDGINDAPALALASVGVAMGAAGTDVALETAEIALMGDDLTRLPAVIALSRRTLRIIRANVLFSLLVKAGFIALTLAGLSSLWLAVLADTGCSLLVVANSLRLLRERR